ncbi:MAG: hypothetical protein Q9157_004946 [Trypethelium eluteriae]
MDEVELNNKQKEKPKLRRQKLDVVFKVFYTCPVQLNGPPRSTGLPSLGPSLKTSSFRAAERLEPLYRLPDLRSFLAEGKRVGNDGMTNGGARQTDGKRQSKEEALVWLVSAAIGSEEETVESERRGAGSGIQNKWRNGWDLDVQKVSSSEE